MIKVLAQLLPTLVVHLGSLSIGLSTALPTILAPPIQLVSLSCHHSHLIFYKSTPTFKTLTNFVAGEQQFNIRSQRLGSIKMVDSNPPGWSSAWRPPLRPAWLDHRQEVLPARLHLAGHDGLAADGRHLPCSPFCLSTSPPHWQSPHWPCLCRWNFLPE